MTAGSRISVLDGGMGTTLESLGHDVSTPLWGCDLLLSDPSIIRDVHFRYVRSGADLIETATYQLTLDGLCRHANLSTNKGKQVMRKGIDIAWESTNNTKSKVVLSIGPFGATLSPGQEYAGIYPPPYGPSSTSSASQQGSTAPHSSDTTNAFNVPEEEETAIKALATFHFERLSVYSDDEEVWSRVEWIAFETIPTIAEITSIRRAMRNLQAKGKAKRFWITSAFPDGRHPQSMPSNTTNDVGRQGKVTVAEVVAAMIGPNDNGPPADGIGINCTNPSFVLDLSDQFTKAVTELQASQVERPVFVLYPDGGSVYDVVTRTWSSGKVDAVSWAKRIAAVARTVEVAEHESGERVWQGVIVGGCCKAGFEEIAALRRELDS